MAMFGTVYLGSVSQISCTNRVKEAVKISWLDPVWLLVLVYFGHISSL
jgi:hypothetical protein